MRGLAGRLVLSVALACLLVPSAAWAQPAQAAASQGAEAAASTGVDIPEDAVYEDDAIIVVYEDAVGSGDAAAQREAEQTTEELDEAGLAVEEVLVEADADSAATVLATVPEGADVEEAIAAAEDVEGVAYAQPNYVYELVDDGWEAEEISAEEYAELEAEEAAEAASGSALGISAVTNDPIAAVSDASTYDNQYYLYGDLLDTVGIKGANVIDAWDYVQCNNEVTVVVMDTGVNLQHVDLQANLLADYCYDFYNDAELEADGDYCGDYYGHGTHVAGIIAATADNGTGIAGTSYNANIISYKITDDDQNDPSADTAWVVEAYQQMLELAEEQPDLNIHIVNLSLGTYSEMTSESDIAMYECICEAREAGIVTVCAGGNGNGINRAYTYSMYPSDWEECLAVTALSSDGTNVSWSDFNEEKDISAPGYQVYSTYNEGDDSYTRMSGTSMAAPIVSGVLALLWAACPDASVDAVVQAIQATADEVDDSDDSYKRNSTGYRGVVSGSAGALDAAGAVEYLLACSQGNHTGGTATCTTPAICEVCGAEYGEVDADAHSWGTEATWEWADDYSSATAMLTCAYDESHVLAQTVTLDDGIVYGVAQEATETSAGSIVYVAVATLNGVTYSSTQVVTVPATGDDASGDDASDSDASGDDASDDDTSSDDASGDDASDGDTSGDDASDGDASDATSGDAADDASTGTDATDADAQDDDSSTSSSGTASSSTAKKANTATITAKKTVKVKASKLKKKARLKKAITVKKAKGTVTYKKVSGSKRLSVTKKGKVKVKKNTKKGTYKIRIKVTVKGTAKYKQKVKTFTVKVKVC